MKRKILELTIVLLLIIGFSNGKVSLVKAEEITGQIGYIINDGTTEGTIEVPMEEVKIVNYLTITQQPLKTNYSKGEELDLTGMVVEGYYTDGTGDVITNYEIIGYNKDQVGSQTVIIYYQNQFVTFEVFVQPRKVMNISTYYNDTTTLALTWDPIDNAARYEIYGLNELTGEFNLLTFAYTNSISLDYLPGTIHSYQICAVENIVGTEYRGEMSDIYTASTDPEVVTGLIVTAIGTNAISLSWNPVNGATGYLIYKSVGATGKYTLIKTTTATKFTNSKLTAGRSYQYKVCAYTFDVNYAGEFSNVVDISTNPKSIAMKYKAGDQKVRLTWGNVYGATTYDLYMGDSVNGIVLLTNSLAKSGVNTYIAEGLTTGSTYSFYAVARREYKGISYISSKSNLLNIAVKPVAPTSSTGKYLKNEQAFYNSIAYKKLSFFSTYVDYSRSYIIPGLISTNIGGFASTRMIPQGLTYAKNY